MNVTKAVSVQQTVDVLPTPQGQRPDPFATARPQSPRTASHLRDSEVLRGAYRAIGHEQPDPPADARPVSRASSTASRPRWLRKVQAWLDGRWGIGHKRKTS